MKEYRILHLEDSQDDADLVKRLLQKADIKFQYFFADTQNSFVKGLTEFHPDIILCDHALPQFDSVMAFDIYQEMKLEIPFILVTGSVSEEYAVEMIKKGIDDYLLKTNLQRLPLAIESAFLKRENEKKVKEGIKKLKYSELMMREAQKIAHLGNWELNFETGIGLWSDEACRIYGLSPEDNKQTFETWISFIHPDDLEYVMKIVNESQKTLINSKMNHRIVLKDGTIKHIHSESKFKMDSTGKPIGLNGIAQDITERKKAKEKLLLSESTLKKAQEIARIGSWRTDLTTGMMEWSEEVCKIYGVKPDENQHTLESLLSFIHPEDLDFVKKEIEKSNATLNENSFYYRIVLKDGTIRNLYVSYRYDVNKEGKAISRYGVTHDVTERKQAEEKLLLSESSLKKAQEIAHIGSWRTDLTTGIMECSEEICKIYGFEPDENQQTVDMILSFVHPEDIDFVKKEIEKTTTTLNDNSFYYRIIRKDGSIRNVYVSYRYDINKEGKAISRYGVTHDVTERKQAEEKLLLSESSLKKAQEIAHIGSWSHDLITDKITWSEEQCRIYGVELDENTQSLESLLSFIHPDEKLYLKGKMEQIEVEQTDNSFYSRIIRKDGSVKNVFVSFKHEYDKEGKPITRYGITHDVTDRIKAEEALQLNYSELKKINSELDRFVYSISHEMRAPLTSVMGLYSIINQQRLDIENKGTLDLINRSILRMDETIRNVLNYSRNARNKVQNEKTDIRTIIEDAFQNYKYLMPNLTFDKKIKIKSAKPFYNDNSRIKIIINNLVSNAIKYSKKENPLSFIHLKISVNVEKLILEIEDNGIGIKSELMSKIFGMFYRATTAAEGTGLGLYIAKECIEKLGGTINVESEFGKGTKFIIEIPNNSSPNI